VRGIYSRDSMRFPAGLDLLVELSHYLDTQPLLGYNIIGIAVFSLLCCV
jgi:hypothetical protein